MTTPYRKDRFLSGNFAPLRAECDAPDLVIEGEVPRELAGTLYRNGPNPQYPPRDRYHMFSGDGMLHALRIEDGRVDYRNRYVRTEKWTLERDAGKSLFGVFGNPMTSDPSVHGKTFNVANTNVLFQGGRLLALEEGSLPFELAPDTLEPIGPWDFSGKLEGPMTAHPKIDPVTGEMIFFGYGKGGFGSDLVGFHVADREGKLVRSESFHAPYSAMIHDFIVTERYVAFPVFPATTSIERAVAGGPPIGWDPSLPSKIGVMPRDGSVEDLRWFEGDACYVFHPMNAFENDGILVADMLRYDAAPGFPGVDGSRADPDKAEARLERWIFDLEGSSDGYRTERLDDAASEFPRIDDRFAGMPYRHGYYASTKGEMGKDTMFDEITHFDHETRTRRSFVLPSGDFTSEPVFVPRAPDAEEGDGFLLAIVYRGAEARSDLLILDATDVAAGPVATAQLDLRVPFGFHGNWHPAQ